MASDPPHLDAQIEELRRALRNGDRHGVQRRLETIEATLSSIGNPLVRGVSYAEVQAALGKPSEAASVLEDLLGVMGDDPVAHYQLGCYRQQAGDLQGAMRAFARAAELDPGRLEAWLNLGTLLDTCGEAAAAMEAYRQALRHAPMDLDVWRNLGNALAALQRFDEAISAYETALGQRPGDRTLVLLRAAAHQAKGDVERANALTPDGLRAEFGAVIEVTDEIGGRALACRFRSPDVDREARCRAARSLLSAAREEVARLDSSAYPVDRTGSVLVRHGSTVLLCDRDPVRPDHPHRFFDASQIVLGASREA